MSRSFRRKSFFDHPWWVAGTIGIGVVLGIAIMSASSWYESAHHAKGIEMTVSPENASAPNAIH